MKLMCPRSLLPVAAVLLAVLPGSARAASSATGEEYLATGEYAEPNILFVIDRSGDMNSPCDVVSTEPCIDTVKNAILQVVQHYDWARYGVVGTSSTAGSDNYYPIAPLGTTYGELATVLPTVSATTFEVRNFAEVIEDLGQSYFPQTTAGDGVDGDGDGINADWVDAPIQYSCQVTHIIVIAVNRPRSDNSVTGPYKPSISPDVKCDSGGIITSGADTLCLYDNVVYKMYNDDFNSSLTGTQNVTVHTVGIGIDPSSVAENLYGNASDVIGGAGIYNVAATGDQVLSSILTVMQDIRAGTYSRSTPIVTASGDYLIYGFYELTGDNPLAYGHIRGYAINNDPTDPDYGQIVYDPLSPYGGAVWDGGDLLVSRPVPGSEYDNGDMDGVGYRDIYTFFEDASTLSGLTVDSNIERRQPFDRQFVTTVAGSSTVRDEILDWNAYSSSTCVPGVGPYADHDFNEDCSIDSSDLQEMVDFLRGRPDAEFRWIDQERGYWKLGDAPYGVPAVVEPRLNHAYSMEPSYRSYLAQQQAANYPSMVFMAANDGMLHAFYLDDLPGTAVNEGGEEAWAWMPGYLLFRTKEPSWAGSAMDLMLYGRTFLFDGSPVVADVWIDQNGDGHKQCATIDPGVSTWADCEWHRVVITQQGKGGPLTLALDITNPLDPQYLWEQYDAGDPTAQGYSVGRPIVAQIRDASDSTDQRDRYIAIWGSGRAVPYSTSTAGYMSAEANLYVWDLAEGPYATADGWPTAGYNPRGDNGHPEAATVPNLDADSHYEQGYIAAALAVVDVDSDGDADTVYFPVSTTYLPTDQGGSGPATTTTDVSKLSDPGATYMYKACFNPTSPDDLSWARFYDPIGDGGLTTRPEVYYAATTTFHSDGSLGVYWGTGSPYSRTSSDNGYFFAVRDTNPMSCDSFTADGISACGANGVYTLSAGEGLTGEPLAYAGVVYFSTWVPQPDVCDGGEGRIYGIRFDDCSPGMDTNGDGVVDSSDSDHVAESGYVSGLTVTEQGNLVYGVHNASMDGLNDLGFRAAEGDPFLGTANLAWMEVF